MITRKTDKDLLGHDNLGSDVRLANVSLHSGAQNLVPVLREGATGNLVIHEHDIDG